ncbi:sigma-70 family RNA polymerase sigma factor [Sorangium sp. So ce1036]|uniref:RNA polymerase sigma factor n=1 Tax=Sorangium sp. So ce1036 TaxID=3133328 RepID=UPI003F0DAAE7
MRRKEAVAEHRRPSRRVEIDALPAVHVRFEVILRHSRMIHAVLRQLAVPARDQPDVMQEIFLSSWRSVEAGRFRPSQDVSLKKALQCWLFAVTWHHVYHYRERMCRLHKEHAACTAPMPPSYAPSPFGQVEARLALRRLEWLGPELRDVLTGTALGYTAKEIVAKLGGNPSTTNGRLHRGRRQLRKVLR